MKTYHHKVIVHWGDTDPAKIVFYPNYFAWFDESTRLFWDSVGLDWDTIRAGLAGFSNDTHNAQGRFIFFQYRGATVIADYGHNPDAMIALVQAVQAMPAARRSVVISGAGDRRDQDIRQQTEILGDAFDSPARST